MPCPVLSMSLQRESEVPYSYDTKEEEDVYEEPITEFYRPRSDQISVPRYDLDIVGHRVNFDPDTQQLITNNRLYHNGYAWVINMGKTNSHYYLMFERQIMRQMSRAPFSAKLLRNRMERAKLNRAILMQKRKKRLLLHINRVKLRVFRKRAEDKEMQRLMQRNYSLKLANGSHNRNMILHRMKLRLQSHLHIVELTRKMHRFDVEHAQAKINRITSTSKANIPDLVDESRAIESIVNDIVVDVSQRLKRPDVETIKAAAGIGSPVTMKQRSLNSPIPGFF
ncbi:hypothetical protein PCE1_001365 [Barthelona sp. PCE]